MDGVCSKFKRELYGSNENAKVRLIFPVESIADNHYDVAKNLSHSTIFEDDNNFVKNMSTETKNNFTPKESITEAKGARRMALEENLLRKASSEVLHEEILNSVKASAHTTEYRDNFTLVNFVPDDYFSGDFNELSLKYPVYGTASNAITAYSYGYRNKNNLLHPFNRYAAFTKSPFERFDVDTSENI